MAAKSQIGIRQIHSATRGDLLPQPVEVNALWLNALVAMAQFARTLGCRTDGYEYVGYVLNPEIAADEIELCLGAQP